MSTGAPNLQKLIAGFLRRVQDLEDSLEDVNRTRFVDEATGIHLDGLGNLVGRARLGLDDEAYRIAIRTQIRVNLSSGTIADLLAVFKAALGDAYTLEIIEFSTASAEFEAILRPAVDAGQVTVLRSLKRAAKAAGVYGILRTTTTSTAFRFAGGTGGSRGFGVGGFASAG